MAITINIAGKPFPFEKTNEGEVFLHQLQVNEQAVRFGYVEEMVKYAYCISAGVARNQNSTFDYTIEQFIKACDNDWKEAVNHLINSETEDKKVEELQVEAEETQSEATATPTREKTKKQDQK